MRKEWIIALAVLAACFAILIGGCRDPAVAPVTTRLSVDSDTVGLWHFNEGSGQAVLDSSSTGWDLTLGEDATVETVDPAWTADGCFGGGLSFMAAQTDYVRGIGMGDFSGNRITVEFWIKTSNTNVSHPALSGNISVAFQLNGTGLLQVQIGDGSDWGETATANTAINDGQWHYVAMTYDGTVGGGTLSLYIDGVLETSESSLGVTLAAPSPWYIGGRPSNTFVDGAMDEVRVSNIARTTSEIAANY